MILVLSFEENLSQLQSNSQTLLCYGTTVGFSIIVSEDILRKLFSDKNPARDKIEILKNVLAVFLFIAVGWGPSELSNTIICIQGSSGS